MYISDASLPFFMSLRRISKQKLKLWRRGMQWRLWILRQKIGIFIYRILLYIYIFKERYYLNIRLLPQVWRYLLKFFASSSYIVTTIMFFSNFFHIFSDPQHLCPVWFCQNLSEMRIAYGILYQPFEPPVLFGWFVICGLGFHQTEALGQGFNRTTGGHVAVTMRGALRRGWDHARQSSEKMRIKRWLFGCKTRKMVQSWCWGDGHTGIDLGIQISSWRSYHQIHKTQFNT